MQPRGGGTGDPLDLTRLTCTNLAIRLKILLKDLPPGEALGFIVRRDQRDTIEPFSRSGYLVRVSQLGRNEYLVRMEREKSRSDDGPGPGPTDGYRE